MIKTTVFKLLMACSTLIIASCAMTKPINNQLLQGELTWTFKQPYKNCYKALVGALNDSKIPIAKTSKEKGMIQTGRASYFVGAVAAGYSAQVVNAEHQFLLKIKGNDKVCQVQTIKYQVWQNNKPVKDIMVPWFRENVWSPLRQSIDSNFADTEWDSDSPAPASKTDSDEMDL